MSDTVTNAVSVSAEQLGRQQGEEFEGHLDFDLGNLMACDPSPQDVRALESDSSAHCLETATKITQSLVAKLFQLPGKPEEMGRIVELPEPAFVLPRQKPLPTPRPPTRWEKFAQQKGIQKRKRSVKVWDEDQQEWRRRFGYQRAGDERDIPILEAGTDDKVGEDPFTEMRREKAQRVKATEKRQLANSKSALKKAGRGAVPPTLKLAAALPEHGKGRPVKRKELKDDIKLASRQAGVATASMGKFDRRLEGEKPGERQLGIKRRKFDPVVGNFAGEKAKVSGTVDRILRERAEDVIDMERAVSNVKRRIQKEPDNEDEDKRKKKKKKSAKPGLKQKGSNKKMRGKAPSKKAQKSQKGKKR